MRAVPRLCEFYSGICLTTEEKARKNLSLNKKNSVRVRKTSFRVQHIYYRKTNTLQDLHTYTRPHTHTHTHTYTHAHTHTNTHKHTHTHYKQYIDIIWFLNTIEFLMGLMTNLNLSCDIYIYIYISYTVCKPASRWWPPPNAMFWPVWSKSINP